MTCTCNIDAVLVHIHALLQDNYQERCAVATKQACFAEVLYCPKPIPKRRSFPLLEASSPGLQKVCFVATGTLERHLTQALCCPRKKKNCCTVPKKKPEKQSFQVCGAWCPLVSLVFCCTFQHFSKTRWSFGAVQRFCCMHKCCTVPKNTIFLEAWGASLRF